MITENPSSRWYRVRSSVRHVAWSIQEGTKPSEPVRTGHGSMYIYFPATLILTEDNLPPDKERQWRTIRLSGSIGPDTIRTTSAEHLEHEWLEPKIRRTMPALHKLHRTFLEQKMGRAIFEASVWLNEVDVWLQPRVREIPENFVAAVGHCLLGSYSNLADVTVSVEPGLPEYHSPINGLVIARNMPERPADPAPAS